jgi:hypothetical protein
MRPLSDVMLEPGTSRKSALTLALESLRAIYREARANPAANWRLIAGPEIAAELHGTALPALQAIEARLARWIEIRIEAGSDAGRPFDIRPQ